MVLARFAADETATARPKTADIEHSRRLQQSLLRLFKRTLDKYTPAFPGAARKQQERETEL